MSSIRASKSLAGHPSHTRANLMRSSRLSLFMSSSDRDCDWGMGAKIAHDAPPRLTSGFQESPVPVTRPRQIQEVNGGRIPTGNPGCGPELNCTLGDGRDRPDFRPEKQSFLRLRNDLFA
jgi:hypothetical protein